MRPDRININADWKHCASDLPAAERIEYDDSRWDTLDLPHDWSIRQAFNQYGSVLPGGSQAHLPTGVMWYRKMLSLPRVDGERVFLEFDGAYRAPDVFVNGRHLAKRFNGYMGFAVDLTPALVDGDNLIAVRLDNSPKDNSRWYTGTGINRNVWLHRVRDLHFMRNGLVIDARADDGSVALSAKASRAGTARFTLLDPDGGEVVRADASAGESVVARVASPRLWSPETPALYACRAELLDATGAVVDTRVERFGFRTVAFTPDQGFLLNGEKVMLRGVNLHEDLDGLGTAVIADGIRRRYAALKAWGVNAVRLAHHPYAPEWYDLADEMGLLVYAEAYDKWNAQFNGWQVSFDQTWRADVADFIDANRNHPSIFIWSVGNETTWEQLDGDYDYGVERYTELADFVKQCDPTRKVTAALYPARSRGVPVKFDRENPETSEMAFAMDVVSSNYLGEYFAADHRKHPNLIWLVSEETTSGGAWRWRGYGHAYGCGTFYWGGYDYLGEAQWPHKNWHRGLMDRSGRRKPISYQLEALWSDKPMVRLSVSDEANSDSVNWNDVQIAWEDLVSHWNWPKGSACRVVLHGNVARLVLKLNGIILLDRPMNEADYGRVNIEVPYAPGELRLVGFDADGHAVAEHTLRTAGPARDLRMTVLADAPAPGGLVHVELEAVDAEGQPTPTSDVVAQVRVNGAGWLAGVVNGDTKSDQRYAANAVRLYNGKALAVVRIRERGLVGIRVKATLSGSSVTKTATVHVP